MAMVMYVGILLLMTGFVALAVDWGHVQMVKTQLQNAADSAARAAAATIYAGPSTARNMAVTYAANNTADGRSVVLDPNADVDLGTWDPAAHTFTVLSTAQQWQANAGGVLWNSGTGKCLDSGAGTAGTQLQIWTCNSTKAQSFNLP